jgi:Icc-related predicted phosphoesterase
VRVLLVSDLHYDLRKLDWLLDAGSDHDVVAVAGDLLNIASPVPLDAQITVVVEYLTRLADRTTVVACSGNHDLDHRTGAGEKATRWIAEVRGAVTDGQSLTVDGWRLTSCAWWEGPATLAELERVLTAAAPSSDRWLWVWHGPPEGPLAWTGSRHHGDPELPRLVAQHAPDVVLCGHIHQAPFAEGGSWSQSQGSTWLFNAGHQLGPVPAHVQLDLDRGTARWTSLSGTQELQLQ